MCVRVCVCVCAECTTALRKISVTYIEANNTNKNRLEKVRKRARERERERERERDGEKQEGFGNSNFFPSQKKFSIWSFVFETGEWKKTGHSVFLPVAIKYASDTHIKALFVLFCTSG